MLPLKSWEFYDQPRLHEQLRIQAVTRDTQEPATRVDWLKSEDIRLLRLKYCKLLALSRRWCHVLRMISCWKKKCNSHQGLGAPGHGPFSSVPPMGTGWQKWALFWKEAAQQKVQQLPIAAVTWRSWRQISNIVFLPFYTWCTPFNSLIFSSSSANGPSLCQPWSRVVHCLAVDVGKDILDKKACSTWWPQRRTKGKIPCWMRNQREMNEILNSEGDYARSCRVFSAIYLHAVRISERLEANLSQDGRPAGNLSWLADFRFDSETTAATSVEVCHRSLPTAHILLRLTSTTQSKKSSPRSITIRVVSVNICKYL